MIEVSSFLKVKVKNEADTFRKLIWLILLLSLFVLLDLYKIFFGEKRSMTPLWNPIGLLFGPALYFGICILRNRTCFNFVKHLSPFFIVGVVYTIAALAFDLHHTKQLASYHYIYLTIPLSLWFYSFLGIKSLLDIEKDIYSREVELMMVNCVAYVFIGLIYLLVFCCWGIFEIDMGLDYRVLVHVLLLVSCMFNVRYLYLYRIKSENDKSYLNSGLKEETAKHYQEEIINCFEHTKIFLRADLSINLLAKELAIPKHHFSEVFNLYFKKSFYAFVADYRIAYAIQKMEESKGTLTLESLAYQSGFNSKSSFNHYFKEKTGYTPTAYQLKVIAT